MSRSYAYDTITNNRRDSFEEMTLANRKQAWSTIDNPQMDYNDIRFQPKNIVAQILLLHLDVDAVRPPCSVDNLPPGAQFSFK